MGRIVVLRLGHRVKRDQRISTHVALTARAFGADEVVFSGEREEALLKSVESVVNKWGGDFKVSYVENWRRYIKDAKESGYYVVHLTMYGLNLPQVIEELKEKHKTSNLLLIVGSAKVPPEVYELADLNVAVSNQPHSEVAALAVALDWIHERRELEKVFENALLRVVPQRKGKVVERVTKG